MYLGTYVCIYHMCDVYGQKGLVIYVYVMPDLCLCFSHFPSQILFLQYSQKIYPCKPRFLTLSQLSLSNEFDIKSLGKPPSRSCFCYSSQISFRKCDTMPKIKGRAEPPRHKFPPTYYLFIN